jgi:hypothetical protein
LYDHQPNRAVPDQIVRIVDAHAKHGVSVTELLGPSS